MKSILALLIICCSLTPTFAQIISQPESGHEVNSKSNPPKEQKRVRKFQFGVSVSPDINYRTIFVNQNVRGASNAVDVYNKIERPKFGMTTGIVLVYNLSALVGFESGVQYSNKGFQSKWVDITTNGGPTYGILQAKYIYDYQYLDIPVKLNLSAGKKAVRFVGSVGLTTNILLNTNYTEKEKLIDGSIISKTGKSKEDFNKVNLSVTFGPGIDYKIAERLSLRIQPVFRFGVLKITDAPISGRLYNAGLNVSLLFGA